MNMSSALILSLLSLDTLDKDTHFLWELMMTTKRDAVKKVNELIGHIKIAMLMTENADGEFHSRPKRNVELSLRQTAYPLSFQ